MAPPAPSPPRQHHHPFSRAEPKPAGRGWRLVLQFETRCYPAPPVTGPRGRAVRLSSSLRPRRRGGALAAPSLAPPGPGTAHPALSRLSLRTLPLPAVARAAAMTKAYPARRRSCLKGPQAGLRTRPSIFGPHHPAAA